MSQSAHEYSLVECRACCCQPATVKKNWRINTWQRRAVAGHRCISFEHVKDFLLTSIEPISIPEVHWGTKLSTRYPRERGKRFVTARSAGHPVTVIFIVKGGTHSVLDELLTPELLPADSEPTSDYLAAAQFNAANLARARTGL